jgi:hypothetical protein
MAKAKAAKDVVMDVDTTIIMTKDAVADIVIKRYKR